MKQTNTALNFQLAQYRAIFSNPFVAKGFATALVITAGTAYNYAHAANQDEKLDVDEWFEALKAGSNTITITGASSDKGDGGKYSNITISTDEKGKETQLKLEPYQQVLIKDTAHPYTDNYIKSSGTGNRLIVGGGGVVEVGSKETSSGKNQHSGLNVQAASGGYVNLNLSRLNVNNAELHVSTAGMSTTSVGASNIFIGNGSGATGKEPTAKVIVSDTNDGDGSGNTTFGKTWSNINVANDGEIVVHASGKADVAAFGSNIQAQNVSINGGRLNFQSGTSGGKTNYSASNTDVNDGYVRVEDGANVTLRVANVNINGKSNVEIGGKLDTYKAHIDVSDSATLAASSGITDGKAQIALSNDSTLNVSKSKLKEFLTGLKEDKTAVKYVDIGDQAATTKDAGKGNIRLATAGTLVITDESAVDISDKDYFKFADKDATAESIYVDHGGQLYAKNVSVTKKVDNADKLTVASDNLSLGSDSFDSAATGTGVRRYFAKNVTFNPKSGENTYTLQDELNLSNDYKVSIKGNVTVSGGSISIGNGSKYEMEPGKDLVLAKDRTISAGKTQNALYIKDASLKISGKLQTTTSGSAYVANGGLDASEATSLSIASKSIKLGHNSAVSFNGKQVLDVTSDTHKVEFKQGSFAEDALVGENSSIISTVSLKGLGAMTMDQYNDLKTKTKFGGFFDGFSISDAKSDPEMDISKVDPGTPNEVYGNTQVTTSRDIDKSVSVGNVEVTVGSKLVVQSQQTGGTFVKLTNAGANGNSSHNFVQDSNGAVADVELAGNEAALQLQGTGNIGSINGQPVGNSKLFIGTPDNSSSADVTVAGNIGDTNPVSEITVQANSDLNVTGDTIRTGNLNIQPGSSITAADADVTVSAKSSFYGDLRANELHFNQNSATNNVIAGGATVDVEKLTASKDSIIQVGEDKQGGQNGNLIAKRLALSGGAVFVDPSYDVEASYAIVDSFAGSKYEHDAGTLSGSAVVGQNAVLAVGFDNKADVVNIIKSKLNEHGAFNQGSDVQNALVLNKQITLAGKDTITVVASVKDAAQAVKKAQAANTAVTFGTGSAIVVTDKAYTSATPNGQKSGSAITLKGDYTKVDASSGGQIILSGRFTANDKNLKIFDTDPGKQLTLTNDISVSSANGLINGKITTTGKGTIDNLTVDPDRLRNMFKNTSKPVQDMLDKTIMGAPDLFDDDSKAGAQFISHVATDSKTGVEADRALHAASYAGAQQAAVDASSAFINALHDRGEAINNSYAARKNRVEIANANYKEDPQRKGNKYEVETPLQAPRDSTGIWATPTYVNTKTEDYDAENASYGAEIDIKGITVGTDARMGDVAFGIAASYGQGDSEGTGNGKGLKDEFDYYGLGLYTAMSFGQFSLIGDTSVTAMKHDISGASGIQGFGNLSTSVDSLAISAGITGKYRFETPFMDITPHFGTRFLRLSTDSYDLYSSEAKSNILNTDYDAQNIYSFPVGISLSKMYKVGGWILNPDLDFTVTMNTGDVDAKSSSKIYGVKDPLNLNTQIMDDVTYNAKVGFGITNGNFNSNLYFNYTGSENSESYSVNASVGYDF